MTCGFGYTAFVVDAYAGLIPGVVSRASGRRRNLGFGWQRWGLFDNALAETINGLYKTELIKHRGPWRTVEQVEFATAEWVDWFQPPKALRVLRGHPASRIGGRLLHSNPAPPSGRELRNKVTGLAMRTGEGMIPQVDARDVAQAVELVRVLRAQLREMAHQLAWVESRNVTTNTQASALRREAAELRRDIQEAQVHIERLCRRYLELNRSGLLGV
jgi:hypothetical protein